MDRGIVLLLDLVECQLKLQLQLGSSQVSGDVFVVRDLVVRKTRGLQIGELVLMDGVLVH